MSRFIDCFHLISVDKTIRSSFINLLLKPVNLILTLVYTPLLLSYLGDTRYGLWAIILSIISWVNYCDIGIGHGLRNILAKEFTCSDWKKAKKTISTAYIILSFIALFLLAISIVISLSLNWKVVFSTDVEMTNTILISMVFIILNFVLALSNSILYALQLSERVAFLGVIVQIINIIGILLLKATTNENLIVLSILFGGSSMIVYVVNTIQLFKKWPNIKPSCCMFDRSIVKDISNIGIKFFIIQLAGLTLFTVDNLIISHLFGAEEVTPFNIVFRVFNTLYSFFAAICIPYWSKTTIAFAENDYKWVGNAIKGLYRICFIFVLMYIIAAIVFKPVVALWLGRELDYQPGLIEVMCLYYILFSIVALNTHIINGTGKINFQVVLMSFLGVINIPLSVFFAKEIGLGVVGVRLATTILIGIAAVSFSINLNYILKKIERNVM